ncbi:MAG: phosphotransferase enzyme family protein [Bacillota bacterium]
MGQPPLAGDEAAVRDLLVSCYGLAPEQLTSVDLLEASVMNPNYVVAVTGAGRHAGNGGRDAAGGAAPASRLVVRCFRRNRDRTRVEFQMRLHEALREAGFPVARVRLNERGQRLNFRDGRAWAVYEWVDGEDHDYGRLDQVRASATLLAELHDFLGRAVIPGYVEPPGFIPYAAWAAAGRLLLTQAFAEDWAKPLTDAERATMLDAHRYMVDRLPARAYAALPKQLVWGDFHGRNLKYDGAVVTGLFDLDVVRWESPLYDLATGLYMFGRTSRADPAIRLDHAAELIRAYAARRPLTGLQASVVLPLLVHRYAPDIIETDFIPPGSDLLREIQRSARILGAMLTVAEPLEAILAEAAGRARKSVSKNG